MDNNHVLPKKRQGHLIKGPFTQVVFNFSVSESWLSASYFLGDKLLILPVPLRPLPFQEGNRDWQGLPQRPLR